MTKTKRVREAVQGALGLAENVCRFSETRLWLDYDQEADVLYISFKKPQRATATIHLDEEGLLLRYRGKELVGITVLAASKRRRRRMNHK
ncbi:MAG: DUF2283 domain-containing protein [Planctomycetes bacterium]|nr:DUF2283 domain-containing protein [Planctomycetota bacterium]